MAIYHFEAKVISRGTGRSAVAAAAYMSCSRLHNDYDGLVFDYTRKRGLVQQEILLPGHAPPEWADREKLWNAVEEAEKSKDSRLARELVIALPAELPRAEQTALIRNYIQEHFVADGMCADLSIHDTDGHNPHAHVILTLRPLDQNGGWQNKTKKEYLCIRDGEERRFTAGEFKAAQADGWEKQYPYKVGKKKVYMAPSTAEAAGYERASKYPKNTKYGRQNPITERWNSEEQLIKWREAWADCVNQAFKDKGITGQIDHRSFKERGIKEQPTVHEGVPSRFIKTSDRRMLNQQIRNDNRYLHEMRAEYEKALAAAEKISIPELAGKMENIFLQLLIDRYNQIQAEKAVSQYGDWLKSMKPDYQKYKTIKNEIKDKKARLHDLKEQQKTVSKLNVVRQMELSKEITTLTEDIGELRSALSNLLLYYPSEAEFSKAAAKVPAVEERMKKQQAVLDSLKKKVSEQTKELLSLKAKASPEKINSLNAEREKLRPEIITQARERLKTAYKNKFDHEQFSDAENRILESLNETKQKASIRQKLKYPKKTPEENIVNIQKEKKKERLR